MTTKFKIPFLLSFFFISCSENGPNPTLENFAVVLETKDIQKLDSITTTKGKMAILNWSDSLQNKGFISRFCKNMRRLQLEFNTEQDTIYWVRLGETDQILGATGGYVAVQIKNGNIKIDNYRGGK